MSRTLMDTDDVRHTPARRDDSSDGAVIVCRSRSSTPYGNGTWGCFTTPSGTTTSSEARLLAYPSGSPSATVTADICPLGGRRSAAVGALCSRLRSTSRYSGCTTARGIVACVADRTACGAPMALPISISISILIPMYPDPYSDPDCDPDCE